MRKLGNLFLDDRKNSTKQHAKRRVLLSVFSIRLRFFQAPLTVEKYSNGSRLIFFKTGRK